MKVAEIKKKLAAISTPGVKGLICDLLMDHDTDTGTFDQEAGIIGYATYVERALGRMETRYKKQLQREDVTIQTRDLEHLIKAVKDGTEPEFKNKVEKEKKNKHGNTTG